jgi:hypothetical protein
MARVEIVAQPSAAAVIVDGNHLGNGAATLVFMGKDRAARRVEVRADGYVTQVLSVTPSAGPTVSIVLSIKTSPAPATVAPTVTEPKPPIRARTNRKPAGRRLPRAKTPPAKTKAKSWKVLE